MTGSGRGAKTITVLLRTKGMKAYGKYGAIGFELLFSIAIGYYLGHWADGKLGTGQWLSLLGFIVGCYAGFKALWRAAKQMEKDVEIEERLERGEDPWAEPEKADAPVDEGAPKGNDVPRG